ncbi:iron-sulfur cluster carrier protein ApbC [Colwellia sp. MEBiC06753]
MFRQLFNQKKSVSEPTLTLITEALAGYQTQAFPYGVLKVASHFACLDDKNKLVIELTLPFPAEAELNPLIQQLSEQLAVEVNLVFNCQINAVRQHSIPNIKNIIAIASGKGGVGKSTTTVNIARAMQAEGLSVGILDADIYGPSIPAMLGQADEKPTTSDGKLMQPVDADGIASMSIGYLVPDSDAAVWRGPMASAAFNQLLNETKWPKLDYLLIDMPPGTGDIQLTLSQKVPVAGAVIVTTPQDIALADAQKGIAMFDKVKVPVIGVVENMSYHQCENCGHHSHIFGAEGGKDIAELNNVPLLGQLPLTLDIRQEADLGENLFNAMPDSDICQQYRKIARNIATKVYYSLDMHSPMAPSVVVEAEQ